MSGGGGAMVGAARSPREARALAEHFAGMALDLDSAGAFRLDMGVPLEGTWTPKAGKGAAAAVAPRPPASVTARAMRVAAGHRPGRTIT